MNLDQAATYLHVSRATLDRWIRQGLLADAGMRGQHFERSILEAWARRRGIKLGGTQERQKAAPENLLAEAAERGVLSSGADVNDAKSAIEAAVSALDLPAEARSALLKETLDRELLAATALGHGVAIPHPRKPQGQLFDAPLISMVFLDPPVDWAAADKQPVHTAILVLSPNTPAHLQLLSRIAFALRAPGFVEFLRERPTQDDLVDNLRHISRNS